MIPSDAAHSCLFGERREERDRTRKWGGDMLDAIGFKHVYLYFVYPKCKQYRLDKLQSSG
jgi:hypothetical protein